MEVSYGKEPFDLRLTCLRLCRNLWKIVAVTEHYCSAAVIM